MIRRLSCTNVLFLRLIYHKKRNEGRTRGSGRNPTLGWICLSRAPPPSLLSTSTTPGASLAASASPFKIYVFSVNPFIWWKRERCCRGLSVDLDCPLVRGELKLSEKDQGARAASRKVSAPSCLTGLDLELSLAMELGPKQLGQRHELPLRLPREGVAWGRGSVCI